jgi:hypothetical protein
LGGAIVKIAAFGSGYIGEGPLGGADGVAPVVVVQKIILGRWVSPSRVDAVAKRYPLAEVVRHGVVR